MDDLQKQDFVDCLTFEEQIEYCHQVANINHGKNPKYFIETLGCQMNHADSEQISGMLMHMEYMPTGNMEQADLIIFNTCCVRETAEFKLYGHIGELKALKQANKKLVTVVCGCMMQQKHVVERIIKSYKQIDIIFGTHNRHEFPKLLYKRLKENKKVYDIWEDSKGIAENVPIERQNGISASVPITYGCNNFCSYCIVPFVRGREISRDPALIKQDIVDLSKKGIKEVTLLGQNVNSYYYDMDFAKLLYHISDVPNIERIRFMTSHPKDLSQDLITAMSEIPTVCSHIHLPLQSGSSKVLQQMNRKYSKEDYLSLVGRIRETIPNIALSTDIIVGFPGETDEDFEETLDIYRQAEFDFAYTFIYSRRTGTPAAKRDDQISTDIKNERFKRLSVLVKQMTQKSNREDENKILKVLTEGKSRTDDSIWTGRTESNKIVNFKGDADFTGKLVDVKIIKGHIWHLEGESI